MLAVVEVYNLITKLLAPLAELPLDLGEPSPTDTGRNDLMPGVMDVTRLTVTAAFESCKIP